MIKKNATKRTSKIPKKVVSKTRCHETMTESAFWSLYAVHLDKSLDFGSLLQNASLKHADCTRAQIRDKSLSINAMCVKTGS
jgi:hypothetical protein